jgi:sugar phosphate isomerase/epimerase
MTGGQDLPASPPRLGATLFSFTREYASGAWSLRDCIERLASLAGEQHLEIVAGQSLSSYPILTGECEREFKDAVEATGVRLCCYDADVDLGWIKGKPFSDARITELLVSNMEIARRLGFPLFRVNAATPALLDRLLPHAERLDLDIVVELHAKTIETPEMQELLALFDRRATSRLGFLQDLGSYTLAVPRAFVEYKANAGVPREIVSAVVSGYLEGRTREEVTEQVVALGGDALSVSTLNECFSMFKRTSPATLAAVMPHLRHVHAKFYEIIDGSEPCIPYPEIIEQLSAAGYAGVLSSEYGGFQFIDRPIAYEQLQAHHELIRRLWRTSTSN